MEKNIVDSKKLWKSTTSTGALHLRVTLDPSTAIWLVSVTERLGRTTERGMPILFES